ncbi:hypothetical protein BLNAU_7965 [Blattamonas nauphoetae]|uniref:Uncharacterized protein n=1 Tax=Blattamonas nauphoetae TaxID=2049346 RepID=A0ABQ9Y089_9EUKA|nr:hypothetical protein BLNAU_7965 [Blattamonas nauphoetae]
MAFAPPRKPRINPQHPSEPRKRNQVVHNDDSDSYQQYSEYYQDRPPKPRYPPTKNHRQNDGVYTDLSAEEYQPENIYKPSKPHRDHKYDDDQSPDVKIRSRPRSRQPKASIPRNEQDSPNEHLPEDNQYGRNDILLETPVDPIHRRQNFDHFDPPQKPAISSGNSYADELRKQIESKQRRKRREKQHQTTEEEWIWGKRTSGAGNPHFDVSGNVVAEYGDMNRRQTELQYVGQSELMLSKGENQHNQNIPSRQPQSFPEASPPAFSPVYPPPYPHSQPPPPQSVEQLYQPSVNHLQRPNMQPGSGQDFLEKRQREQMYRDELKRQAEEKRRQKQEEKRREEEYNRRLDEQITSYNPYGRGGSGAPIKDEYGNTVANLASVRNGFRPNEPHQPTSHHSRPQNQMQPQPLQPQHPSQYLPHYYPNVTPQFQQPPQHFSMQQYQPDRDSPPSFSHQPQPQYHPSHYPQAHPAIPQQYSRPPHSLDDITPEKVVPTSEKKLANFSPEQIKHMKQQEALQRQIEEKKRRQQEERRLQEELEKRDNERVERELRELSEKYSKNPASPQRRRRNLGPSVKEPTPTFESNVVVLPAKPRKSDPVQPQSLPSSKNAGLTQTGLYQRQKGAEPLNPTPAVPDPVPQKPNSELRSIDDMSLADIKESLKDIKSFLANLSQQPVRNPKRSTPAQSSRSQTPTSDPFASTNELPSISYITAPSVHTPLDNVRHSRKRPSIGLNSVSPPGSP